jgi:hypothetical protein
VGDHVGNGGCGSGPGPAGVDHARADDRRDRPADSTHDGASGDDHGADGTPHHPAAGLDDPRPEYHATQHRTDDRRRDPAADDGGSGPAAAHHA